MIAVMRKLINNNAYKIFLWVFLIMMGMGSGLVFFHNEDEKNWVMKVYKQTWSDKKYATVLQQVKQQQEMFKQRGYAFALQNPQKEAVESGLNDLLSQHAVSKLGIHVAPSHVDKEVQKQLQHLPAYFFKENGALNEDAFRKLIAPSSIEDFVSAIESDAKNKLLLGLVDVSLYVPEFELKVQYAVDFADKTYSYCTLPLSKFLQAARQNTPSDETLLKFYKKAAIAERFKTAELRSGKLWTFDQSQYVTSISNEDAKQFYDKNKNSRYVITPAQMQVRLLVLSVEPGKEQETITRIQELKQEADKDPSSFEGLVRKFSDDKATADKGGLTDLFTKNDKKINKLVIDTAFEYLGTDGQVSAAIKTDRGYELIQRVKKVPAKYKEFAAVENEIKQDLGAEKFKKRFVQDATRVLHGAKYNPEALSAFIKRYHGQLSKIDMSSRKSGLEYTHLFKLEEGRYTQYFDKNTGVIILCDQIEKSVLPPLSDHKDKVLNLYYKQQAQEQLKDQLSKALKDTKLMTFDDVAKKYNMSIQQASVRNSDGKAEYSAILKDQDVQAKVKVLQCPGAIIALETAADGVLIRLDTVEQGDNQFETQKEQLSKVVFYTKLYQSREGFVASLYRIAKLNNKIEIKNEILQFTKEV